MNPIQSSSSSPDPSSLWLLANLHGELGPKEKKLLGQNLSKDPDLVKEAGEMEQTDAHLRQSLSNHQPDPQYRLTPKQRAELMTMIGQPTLLTSSPSEIRQHHLRRRWNSLAVWAGGMAAAAMVAVAFLSNTDPTAHSQSATAQGKEHETKVNLAKPEKVAPKLSPLPAPPSGLEKHFAREVPLPPAPALSPILPGPLPANQPAVATTPKDDPSKVIKDKDKNEQGTRTVKEEKPGRVMAAPPPLKK